MLISNDCSITVELMLDGVDLSEPHELEQVRRSIAMALPGSWALKREEALRLLDLLIQGRNAER